MGTQFSTIIDMAWVVMQDYKLDALFQQDPDTFAQVMTNYLVKSVPKFSGCMQDLSYDLTTSSFNSTLTVKEIDILADYTVLTWYESHNNDVLIFTESLRDSDFNRYATGQNMDKRILAVDTLREKVRQDVTDYHLETTNLNTLMGV